MRCTRWRTVLRWMNSALAVSARLRSASRNVHAVTIIGSYLGSAVPSRDIPKYVEMWRDGKLPVEKLISHRIRLDDINRAMDELAEGRAVRQVIIMDEE